MKKFFLSTLFAALAFAGYNQTTYDEYNYVTKGYQRVLTESADVKRGYVVKEIMRTAPQKATWGSTNQFVISILQTEDTKTPKGIIITQYMDGKLLRVYCQPLYNSPQDLWQNYFTSIDQMTGAQKSLLLYTLGGLYAGMVVQHPNDFK